MKFRLLIYSLMLAVFVINTTAQNTDLFKRKAIEARMLLVVKWQLANPKHQLYDWTNGAFYAGVFAAYLPSVRKGWTGLNTLVHADGKVGWTQPIGADPRRNFTAESWEVYGAGAYVLATSEVVKL